MRESYGTDPLICNANATDLGNTTNMPIVLTREIYLLIMKYLSSDGRFKEASDAFLDALKRNALLPQRLAWDGSEQCIEWLELVIYKLNLLMLPHILFI